MEFRKAWDLFPDIDETPERRRGNFPELRDEHFWELYDLASPSSLATIPAFYNVYQSMHYIARNGVPGALVECGCFLGGMGIFMTSLRDELGLSDCSVFLFDTFEGFPHDSVDPARGERPWRRSSFLNATRQNILEALGHTRDVNFVVGAVEQTAPAFTGGPLAMLRLDTDHYQSTLAELKCLYPKLSRGGVLILDDYGFYEGSRNATDEYLATLAAPPLLNRINCATWAGVKP
jgi:O-methyltransferase